MVFILSALWWIRIRGLWKFTDGKDWLWENLGLVLKGGLCSVQFSRSVMSPWTAARQTPLSITNSRSLLKFMSIELWCHPTISSSVFHFSSHLQSFLASGSFPVSQLFTSGGPSIGVSASVSVFPMNRMDWFDLLAVQGTFKSLFLHHSSKASILQCSAFFIGAMLSKSFFF